MPLRLFESFNRFDHLCFVIALVKSPYLIHLPDLP